MKLAAWVVSIAAVFASAAFAQNDDVRVVVVFNGGADETVITGNGGAVVTHMSGHNAIVATIPAGKAAKIKGHSTVAAVVEDGIASASQDRAKAPKGNGSTPTQPLETLPWGVNRIDADIAQTRGAGVTVAVLDTGVNLTHPDLQGNLSPSSTWADFVDKVKSPEDQNGHGSHVAGIIAAIDNSIGVVGVACDAKIMPVQVLNRSGSGSYSGVALGIDHASAMGAKVINMSLGGPAPSLTHPIYASIANAYANGVLLVAASGNESASSPGFPASDPLVMAVGATDINDAVASWSNDGEDILGPGVSVYSTYKGSNYATLSGTSMGCPHVAGVAALVYTRNLDADSANDVGPGNVWTILTSTSENIGASSGLVDAAAATQP